jgi:hypothetical protein
MNTGQNITKGNGQNHVYYRHQFSGFHGIWYEQHVNGILFNSLVNDFTNVAATQIHEVGATKV